MTFRFVFAFFALLSLDLLSDLISVFGYFLTGRAVVASLTKALFGRLVFWASTYLFHVSGTLAPSNNGSGDTTYNWVLLLCEIWVAIVVTCIWSLLDWHRLEYRRLHAWLRLFVRFFLGALMIVYGADKAFPLQFGSLSLTRLVEPVGEMSPASMLWTFMAASKPYTILSGIAELLGGTLLFIPQLTALGALISVAAMSNVFALNMTYDIPVKLLSFEMLLMALFLAAPEARQLANVLVLRRATTPASETPLFRRRRPNTVALVIQLVLGACVLGVLLYSAGKTYAKVQQANAIRPPLYGIWSVDEFSGEGIKGSARWSRMIFDRANQVSIQLMDGSLKNFQLKLDAGQHTMSLSEPGNSNLKCYLTFATPERRILILDGDVDGSKVDAKLRWSNDSLELINRGFHWISETPYYR